MCTLLNSMLYVEQCRLLLASQAVKYLYSYSHITCLRSWCVRILEGAQECPLCITAYFCCQGLSLTFVISLSDLYTRLRSTTCIEIKRAGSAIYSILVLVVPCRKI